MEPADHIGARCAPSNHRSGPGCSRERHAVPRAVGRNHLQSRLLEGGPTSDSQYEPVERRIIAGRCRQELRPGGVVTLGIRMPEAILTLAAERAHSDFTLTVDAGIIGGTLAGGHDFGPAANRLRFSHTRTCWTSCLVADRTKPSWGLRNAIRRAM